VSLISPAITPRYFNGCCAIQAWLGHRSITSTAIYTALARNRFKDFWRD
jgi:site-specific recombinase XerD